MVCLLALKDKKRKNENFVQDAYLGMQIREKLYTYDFEDSQGIQYRLTQRC